MHLKQPTQTYGEIPNTIFKGPLHMENRLNIKSLVEAVELHEAFADTPKYQIEDVLRKLFSTIEDAVIAGDKVAVPGFGTFTKFTSSTTGKSKPKFTASTTFKDKVNA